MNVEAINKILGKVYKRIGMAVNSAGKADPSGELLIINPSGDDGFVIELKKGVTLPEINKEVPHTEGKEETPATDEGEEEEIKSEIVPRKYRLKYGASQSCGDELSEVLTDFTTEPNKNSRGRKTNLVALKEVCSDNSIDLDKWSHLNIGMQRMNLGNVLRGKLIRGEKVTIGTWSVEERDEKEESLL